MGCIYFETPCNSFKDFFSKSLTRYYSIKAFAICFYNKSLAIYFCTNSFPLQLLDFSGILLSFIFSLIISASNASRFLLLSFSFDAYFPDRVVLLLLFFLNSFLSFSSLTLSSSFKLITNVIFARFYNLFYPFFFLLLLRLYYFPHFISFYLNYFILFLSFYSFKSVSVLADGFSLEFE